ncbi:protein-arginine deiminase [Stackebrandtia endophytica]|uniref:Protein-arginine deiminase n=1 Tax=Stackebrandtia endophytica TaxID=1496996 RepID=A0A543AW25_9ACTN|nr:protein-arginine deiminase family protein [Stackebrandtia endophytica]TQL76760.1 protein-arginine deiminase [Stackebrandtia endophytica]
MGKLITSRRLRWVTAGLAVVLTASAGTIVWQLSQRSETLLLADTDRDGLISEADRSGRAQWSTERGAIVVPNLDDDGGNCGTFTDEEGQRRGDDALAACGDAFDQQVNGDADLLDLAPLRIEPIADVGTDAWATVTVDEASIDSARLFIRSTEGEYSPLAPGEHISADRLRGGVDLALEATDIARDSEVWNGFIDVSLQVHDGQTVTMDRVRVRVAPLLLSHDLNPIDRMMIADNATTPEDAERHDYDPTTADPVYPGEDAFRDELSQGLAEAGLDGPTYYPTGGDRWMRDQFITGMAAMPGPDGTVHTMTVLLRSAVVDPEGSTEEFPLRDAGRPVYSMLRGPDVAAVQTYSPDRVGDDDYNMLWGSFNSTGNFIVAPPYATDDGSWPVGRVLYGSDGGDAAPDPAFVTLLEAQRDQDPLPIDTSWLGVGHIDEFLSFIPADNDRGWAAVVADPDLGEELLAKLVAAGRGDHPLMSGIAEGDLTVEEAMKSTDLTNGNRIAAAGIEAAIRVLTDELDLGKDELVRIPALFTDLVIDGYPRQDIVANLLPAIVNGVETGTGVYLAVRPHGPLDDTGNDVFAHAAETAFAAVGGRIAWVEAFEYGHDSGTVGGEIHCLTNTIREHVGEPWWRA